MHAVGCLFVKDCAVLTQEETAEGSIWQAPNGALPWARTWSPARGSCAAGSGKALPSCDGGQSLGQVRCGWWAFKNMRGVQFRGVAVNHTHSYPFTVTSKQSADKDAVHVCIACTHKATPPPACPPQQLFMVNVGQQPTARNVVHATSCATPHTRRAAPCLARSGTHTP